jgi:hypothetical protein
MRRGVASAVLAAGLVLAACGDDDEADPAAPSADDGTRAPVTVPEATSGATAAPAATVAASAGPATTVAAPPASPPAAPPAGGGSECSVTITGAVTAEWTSDRSGPQAIVVGDWLADPSSEDAGYFGLYCFDADFNIVGFTSAFTATIPAQPATYQITGEMGDPIEADVAVLDDEGLWEPTGGVLEFVEFDDSHVRGTFSFEIEDSFDPTRTAHVEGTFAHTR